MKKLPQEPLGRGFERGQRLTLSASMVERLAPDRFQNTLVGWSWLNGNRLRKVVICPLKPVLIKRRIITGKYMKMDHRVHHHQGEVIHLRRPKCLDSQTFSLLQPG